MTRLESIQFGFILFHHISLNSNLFMMYFEINPVNEAQKRIVFEPFMIENELNQQPELHIFV